MENTSKISKLFLYLTLISFAIFTGSYITKIAILNNYFDAETMQLKEMFIEENLTLALSSMLPVFSTTIISFLCFLFFYLIFLLSSKINLKNEGWLFIITLIIIVTSPFEVYLLINYDWEIINHLVSTVFSPDVIVHLFRARMTVLGPFPLLLLFSHFIVIFLALFKPLRKKA